MTADAWDYLRTCNRCGQTYPALAHRCAHCGGQEFSLPKAAPGSTAEHVEPADPPETSRAAATAETVERIQPPEPSRSADHAGPVEAAGETAANVEAADGSPAWRYPGGKNSEGLYHWIINQIPPHDLYVEPFAGSAAIARHKRPARHTILADTNPAALDVLRGAVLPGALLIRADALELLAALKLTPRAFVYLDPPYMLGTRRSRKRYYGPRELSDADHADLLDLVRRLPCRVALSGYPSTLYDRRLADWRRLTYTATLRNGAKATEVLWMNYPEPPALHDYRQLGANYREREKLRKQQRRWAARLARMDRHQRLALLAALDEVS